jgi:hypothetical protein
VEEVLCPREILSAGIEVAAQHGRRP